MVSSDLRAVFQQTFDQLAYENMPPLLKPIKGKLGLQDHEKVFCVDHKGLGDVFEMRGIDREMGCLVVVRPDQYVAYVLPLDAFDELTTFFGRLSGLGDASVISVRRSIAAPRRRPLVERHKVRSTKSNP